MEVRFVANANLFLSGPHINFETHITSYPLRSGSTFLEAERAARQASHLHLSSVTVASQYPTTRLHGAVFKQAQE